MPHKIKRRENLDSKLIANFHFCIQLYAQYNSKSEILAEPQLNFEVSEEFNLGGCLKTDGKALTEAWPQFVYKPKDKPDSMYWVRGDVFRKIVGLGCDQRIRDGIQHTFEGRYTHESTGGIMASPVSLHTGVDYDLSDKTSLAFAANIAETRDCEFEVTHKIDSNWTVSAKQCMDGGKATSSSTTGARPYHLGFTATYKL